MVIANPIYDVVFKSLMQNTRISRFFVETLIEETIEDIEVQPQEFIYNDKVQNLGVSRYDFIATIRTNDGKHKKVLIEIQKARHSVDLMRFRNYLGDQYKKEDEILTEIGRVKSPLPIIAIYLLGFNLYGIDSPAIKVARNYTDLITHTTINRKNDFIENLSHDCYIIVLPKIKGKVLTRLEELLSIFEQNNFADEKGLIKVYNHETNNEGINNMVNMLHYIGTDPERKKEIEIEQEGRRTIDAWGGEKMKVLELKVENAERKLAEKQIALEDARMEIEKERQEREKEKLEREKEKELLKAMAIELERLKQKLGE